MLHCFAMFFNLKNWWPIWVYFIEGRCIWESLIGNFCWFTCPGIKMGKDGSFTRASFRWGCHTNKESSVCFCWIWHYWLRKFSVLFLKGLLYNQRLVIYFLCFSLHFCLGDLNGLLFCWNFKLKKLAGCFWCSQLCCTEHFFGLLLQFVLILV